MMRNIAPSPSARTPFTSLGAAVADPPAGVQEAGGGSECSAGGAPKLAVIIACHNYAPFVGQAISSVQGQHGPCELLVVDDGSTDESWEVIKASGARAIRIPNSGQAGACLHGLDQTTAPFIYFLDADDVLKPGALDQIITHLDPGVAKLQFGLTPIDADGQLLKNSGSHFASFRERKAILDQVLNSGVYATPPTSGNVFRRDLCELLREVDYDRAVDGVILFAAPLFGDVVSLSQELGCYRIHDRNDSGVGGRPETATLERDLARFEARMRHLRDIVLRTTGGRMQASEATFYYQERRLYLDILSGRRPRLGQMRRLLTTTLGQQSQSAQAKLRFLVFLSVLAMLPRRHAISALNYRLKASARTGLGLLREMIVGSAPAA
jgi:glycosyltransferase involved in cell wall biosynthesis